MQLRSPIDKYISKNNTCSISTHERGENSSNSQNESEMLYLVAKLLDSLGSQFVHSNQSFQDDLVRLT